MKKLLLVTIVGIIISLTVSSCMACSDECWLDGCERKGQGWSNGSECASWGVCRISETGYYCSKEHALRGR